MMRDTPFPLTTAHARTHTHTGYILSRIAHLLPVSTKKHFAYETINEKKKNKQAANVNRTDPSHTYASLSVLYVHPLCNSLASG